MTTIAVRVTQEHIARRLDPGPTGGLVDPIAVAIGDAFGGVSVDVSGDRESMQAVLGDDRALLVVDLPSPAEAWVREFDLNGGSVLEPIDFEVELPDWLVKACSEQAGRDDAARRSLS